MNKRLITFLTLGTLVVGCGAYSLVSVDDNARLMEKPYETLAEEGPHAIKEDAAEHHKKEEKANQSNDDYVVAHKPVSNSNKTNETNSNKIEESKPSTPSKPSESSKPSDSVPSTPVKPGTDDNVDSTPVKPNEPIKPSVPSTPLQPSTPVKPSEPVKPSKPNTDDETSNKPSTDDSTSKPSKPSTDSETNNKPSKPSTDNNATSKPSKPSTDSETNNKPSTDDNTSKPSKPSTDNNATSKPSVGTGETNVANADSMVQEVLSLVNQERAKMGLSPLSIDATLQKSAMAKSKDMALNNYFDHNSPTYGTPFQMMKQFGITYRAAAENIAKGQTSAAQVMNSWMNSSGHRANILGNYTHIGIGIYKNANGQILWTQQFISK